MADGTSGVAVSCKDDEVRAERTFRGASRTAGRPTQEPVPPNGPRPSPSPTAGPADADSQLLRAAKPTHSRPHKKRGSGGVAGTRVPSIRPGVAFEWAEVLPLREHSARVRGARAKTAQGGSATRGLRGGRRTRGVALQERRLDSRVAVPSPRSGEDPPPAGQGSGRRLTRRYGPLGLG
ncbi:hypothetical protein GCM10010176_064400 [Nonomuraea spiralis]|nr:hypothetical protein GCM10010176_064400 [Nonomuraea spiralis]